LEPEDGSGLFLRSVGIHYHTTHSHSAEDLRTQPPLWNVEPSYVRFFNQNHDFLVTRHSTDFVISSFPALAAFGLFSDCSHVDLHFGSGKIFCTNRRTVDSAYATILINVA